MTTGKLIYEDIVFAQGEDAIEPLEILAEKGRDAAIDFLAQWHDLGKHMTREEPAAGTSDTVYEKDSYILTYNLRLGYIGLEYKVTKAYDVCS
jgi:hypothetical protein